MMPSIADICHEACSLSDVQIHILTNSEDLLQFASDLSHREVLVFVPGSKKGTVALAAYRFPLLAPLGNGGGRDKVGTEYAGYEEPLVLRALQSGQIVQGLKEVEYGQVVPLVAYPFVDNGGTTIAVVAFMGKVEENRRILTETAFLALQVPIGGDARQLYCPLSLQDGIVLINCNGVVIYADEMAESILHMRNRSGALVGSNIYNTSMNLTGAKQALATREGFVEDVTLGEVVVTRRVIPLLRRGKVHRVIAVLTERTELYRKEEELMIKTSVIKEIHHRVKNNLQTIASLLRMQMRRTKSREAKDVLQESVNRILSISLVHEILSHHDEERIDISSVARQLLSLLAHGMAGVDCRVGTEFSGQPLQLPSDMATSLALVLNELITNAITHGFEGLPSGSVQVAISREDDLCVLSVADDGVGMKPQEELQRSHLGLTIVRTLVEKDLRGKLEFLPAAPHGTKVVIRFKV